MKSIRCAIALILAAGLVGGLELSARAGMVVLPNFDSKSGPGMNRTDLKNWMVMHESVNLYPNSTHNPLNSGQPYLGMQPGAWMNTNELFTVRPGDYIELEVASPADGKDALLILALGQDQSATLPVYLPPGQPFTTVRWYFPISGPVTADINIDNPAGSEPFIRIPSQVTPEPTTWLLFGMTALGLLGAGWVRRRQPA
jgi:hypothetical protein